MFITLRVPSPMIPRSGTPSRSACSVSGRFCGFASEYARVSFVPSDHVGSCASDRPSLGLSGRMIFGIYCHAGSIETFRASRNDPHRPPTPRFFRRSRLDVSLLEQRYVPSPVAGILALKGIIKAKPPSDVPSEIQNSLTCVPFSVREMPTPRNRLSSARRMPQDQCSQHPRP